MVLKLEAIQKNFSHLKGAKHQKQDRGLGPSLPGAPKDRICFAPRFECELARRCGGVNNGEGGPRITKKNKKL